MSTSEKATMNTFVVVMDLLRSAIINVNDDITRAEMQQKRFPYDHDNNDALERYRSRARELDLAKNDVRSRL